MEIFDNVPIPPVRGNKIGNITKLIDSMDSGQSILVPKKEANSYRVGARMSGKKCATRSEGDMLRIWVL